jgi:nitroimidazol reductase NimA-like FMN-containing flavoprotein (pyridoxamine 5'-phosphate oxidase superfamily)
MKNIFSRFSIVFVVLLVFSVFLSNPVIAESTSVTIVGEVNDQYQIVTDDGTIYEIADTELGNELLQHIGEVVEVKGDVEEEDDVKVLDVKSFGTKEE